nr:hypothetical protein CFP56_04390 [Quercus suber]
MQCQRRTFARSAAIACLAQNECHLVSVTRIAWDSPGVDNVAVRIHEWGAALPDVCMFMQMMLLVTKPAESLGASGYDWLAEPTVEHHPSRSSVTSSWRRLNQKS